MPEPALVFCAEKGRLRHTYVSALQKLVNLLEAELSAMGGRRPERMGLALTLARSKTEKAKHAYKVHIQAHRC